MKVSLVSFSVICNNWGGDRIVILFFLLLDFELAIDILHVRFFNWWNILHLALSQAKTVISVLNYSCGLLLNLTELVHNSIPGLSYLIRQLLLNINNYFIDRLGVGKISLKVFDCILIFGSNFLDILLLFSLHLLFSQFY